MLIFFASAFIMLVIVILSIKLFKYCIRKKPEQKNDENINVNIEIVFEKNNLHKDFETFKKLKQMERKSIQEYYLNESSKGSKYKKCKYIITESLP